MEVTIRHHWSSAAPWTTLERELDAWAEAGRTATLWWRDDDATRPGPALDRLLDLRGDLPLAIAVIPARTDARLAERLAGEAGVSVIQHGIRHRNNAPPGADKAELDGRQPLAATLRGLAGGRRRLARLFGRVFAPVLAPPWNRIDRAVARSVGHSGLRALSGFGAVAPELGARQINSHLDPIDWRGTRGFVGDAAALATLAGHLGERRRGEIPDRPSGLLTHHRDNDAAVWRFLAALVECTRAHPAARWVSIQDQL